jgi:predicted acylesterase/phospholipase RssA
MMAGQGIVAGLARVAAAGALVLGLAGCATMSRQAAVPMAQLSQTRILDIPNARFFVDADPAPMYAEALRSLEKERAYAHVGGRLPPANFLAISGGGDDGAFGAGLLVGWSEHGTRPEFKLVTGISTGALLAPFAFLGKRYDPQLAAMYTTITQKNIFIKRGLLAGLTEDALGDTTPLYGLITQYLSAPVIEEIAREYDRGRLLLIATTNLDAGRPVIWNIGAIAKSRNPKAHVLIRRILLASAAVPGAFPPVMFDMEIDGKPYQELHVDGGAVAQAFLYPPTMSLKRAPAEDARRRTAYIIRNSKLNVPFDQTKRSTLPIAGRAISTLLASSGVNDMYRMYLTTQRDGVGYNLAFIGNDFNVPYPGMFDHGYMTALFEYGRAKGRAGVKWQKKPPGFAS